MRIYTKGLLFVLFLWTTGCHGKPGTTNSKGVQAMEPVKSGDIIEQDSLSGLIQASLHLGEYQGDQFVINTTEEKELLQQIKNVVHDGAEINGEDILMLVQRDGSGDGYITSKPILEFLLENYKEDTKQELLDNMVLESILNADSRIVELLINKGANPGPEKITAAIQGTSPDYYPSYETLKALVERLHFDLYKECNVTLLWWILQERQFFGGSEKDVDHIRAELEARREEAFLPCNENQVFDPDFFAVSRSAYDLGIASDDTIIADIFKALK
ncbi:hypothetical protein [Sinomicrobium weinanense]|uniref:Ankyrin repeat domain-containing protein n=1 Tax=Sinomicrobium weinanense TaxID=2842200 RepID=A0A926JPY5_9FLAO|nr:hypothetical protein [Sinomicrobium weinanense]MBC9795229.1 hypothetical protein [Sinomicrobium weinanense]MBU3122006.1 hypothetical protein [Sinomicrobium weinanense]